MAYPQAPAEMPLYIRLPPRIQPQWNVMKDTCTQVAAQCGWTKSNRPRMEQIHVPGHKRNRFQAEFIRSMIFGPDGTSIDAGVVDLRACSHRFTVEDQGDIGDFLFIQVQKFPNGTIHLTQPQLIDAIIKDLHLQIGVKCEEDTCGAQQSPPQRHRRPRHDSRVPLS